MFKLVKKVEKVPELFEVDGVRTSIENVIVGDETGVILFDGEIEVPDSMVVTDCNGIVSIDASNLVIDPSIELVSQLEKAGFKILNTGSEDTTDTCIWSKEITCLADLDELDLTDKQRLGVEYNIAPEITESMLENIIVVTNELMPCFESLTSNRVGVNIDTGGVVIITTNAQGFNTDEDVEGVKSWDANFNTLEELLTNSGLSFKTSKPVEKDTILAEDKEGSDSHLDGINTLDELLTNSGLSFKTSKPVEKDTRFSRIACIEDINSLRLGKELRLSLEYVIADLLCKDCLEPIYFYNSYTMTDSGVSYKKVGDKVFLLSSKDGKDIHDGVHDLNSEFTTLQEFLISMDLHFVTPKNNTELDGNVLSSIDDILYLNTDDYIKKGIIYTMFVVLDTYGMNYVFNLSMEEIESEIGTINGVGAVVVEDEGVVSILINATKPNSVFYPDHTESLTLVDKYFNYNH